MWLNIRVSSTCTIGALNIMRSIELIRVLPAELQNIIMKPVCIRTLIGLIKSV